MAFDLAPDQWVVKPLHVFENFNLAEVKDGKNPVGLALLFRNESLCMQHCHRLQEAACNGMLSLKGKYMLNSCFTLLCEYGKLVARQLKKTQGEEVPLEELVDLAKGLLGTLRDLHAKNVCGFAISIHSVVMVPEAVQVLQLFTFLTAKKSKRDKQAHDIYQAAFFLFCITLHNDVAMPSTLEATKALVIDRTANTDPAWRDFLQSMLGANQSAAKLCEDLERIKLASVGPFLYSAGSDSPAFGSQSRELEDSFNEVVEWLVHGCTEAAYRTLRTLLVRVQREGSRLEVQVCNPLQSCCRCRKAQVRMGLLRLVCLHFICGECLRAAIRDSPNPCSSACPVTLELQSQETSRLPVSLQESYTVYEWLIAP